MNYVKVSYKLFREITILETKDSKRVFDKNPKSGYLV